MGVGQKLSKDDEGGPLLNIVIIMIAICVIHHYWRIACKSDIHFWIQPLEVAFLGSWKQAFSTKVLNFG